MNLTWGLFLDSFHFQAGGQNSKSTTIQAPTLVYLLKFCQFCVPTLENLLDNLNAENWCTAWLSVIVLQLSWLLCSEVLRRMSKRETPEFVLDSGFALVPTGFGCELNLAFLGWEELVWSCRMERKELSTFCKIRNGCHACIKQSRVSKEAYHIWITLWSRNAAPTAAIAVITTKYIGSIDWSVRRCQWTTGSSSKKRWLQGIQILSFYGQTCQSKTIQNLW